MKPVLRKGVSKLRPRANIIRMLGDELISSDAVAVTELVKNAYDADATEVTVRFTGDIENQEGEIEIVDNGHGMSLDTVLSAWMEPATNVKKKRKQTAGGRRVLGEKGTGRFAAARLGSRLEMVTKQMEFPNETIVSFEWDSFDSDGYLDEIECNWQERGPRAIEDHGTLLRLSGLQDAWTNEDLKNLRNALSRTISPFESITDFKIVLVLPPKFRELAGVVTPSELLNHCNYLIKGEVNKIGEYDLIYIGGAGKKEHLCGTFSKNRVYESGSFQIELRVFDLDRAKIQTLADVFKMKLEKVREELKNRSGIYIYRDEFRVLPYGDPNNDWLRLDIRRVQNPTLRVSNNQVVGCTLISANRNPQLKDQTNREGIIASKAFSDLRTLIVNVLSQLERKRYQERPRQKQVRDRRGGLFADFNLNPVRSAVEERHSSDKQLLNILEQQERQLSEKVEAVQEVLARYLRLASLGQLVDEFLHEGRTPLTKISSEAELGIQALSKIKERSKLTDRMARRFEFIMAQTDTLSQLFRKMEPFGGRKRGRPAKVCLESVIQDAFSLHEGRIKKLGVHHDLPTTQTELTVDPVEMQQVVSNLLDNSLHWLELEDKSKRRILVKVDRLPEGEVRILFCDSGPGVQPEDREHVFDPYFSTKANGIGLGLSLVGEIVSEYGGDLELVTGPLPGACFSVTLRRRI